MITTITGKNQVTLPAALVRDLELKPGTRLDWSVGEGGTLEARPLPGRGELARQLTGRGRRYLRSGRDPVADLVADRVREDEEEGLS